ncbi:TolC family protein [Marinovum sp. 2_MG-2023]|uniref:TolC family protein n=1 Tax=unclassified Marinovum TaxID=2647166 RepID=UPI0026E22493|nr:MULTISPECIES: TolC family protein [unclassified Marinovum]MDO6730756.1 TolC family protein [Marinovum sp. 2_MG-2023]MDO6780039.1 TolC family protein [Marinovum sp. 1_MG-2023]
MSDGDGAGNSVTRFLQSKPMLNGSAEQGGEADTAAAAEKQGVASPIIATLQERRSILDPASPYGAVAGAVMASSARTAEAELRAARLRAQAASKNWLPSIGPNISLNSMGEFVTSLFIEQVIYDNGRKKAERDFAAHDVEFAAVTLSQDSNTRVHDALGLYLAAEEGREKITVAERSLEDMGHFEWVMNERVQGGVSDRSDLNIIRQKLAEIRSQRDTALGDSRAALAELAAMAGHPLEELRGVPALRVDAEGTEPLTVLKAKADRDRSIAEAKIARAGHLPGLKAGGTVSGDNSDFGLSLAADQLLGLGTGASLKAIEAAKEAAGRKVTQADEDARRKISALRQREVALARQLTDANTLARQAKHNLDLFQAQYEAGARQVMDVVGVYETWARQSGAAITLKYDLARVQISLARAYGLLANGSEI